MAENNTVTSYNLGDYNRGGYIAFMFCMVFTILFFIYIAFVHPGVDLKEVEAQIQKEQSATPPSAAQAPAAEPAADAKTEEPKQ